MAQIIRVDGSREECEKSLEAYQEAVGGYIEAVTLRNEGLLFVNDEGLLQRLPVNHTASALAEKLIVGTVVLLTEEEAAEERGE